MGGPLKGFFGSCSLGFETFKYEGVDASSELVYRVSPREHPLTVLLDHQDLYTFRDCRSDSSARRKEGEE